MRRASHRKGNWLKDYDHGQDGAYFVTVCVKDHAQAFGTIVGQQPDAQT